MLTALAVANSIEKVTGLKAQIKWPNDVLVNGKKISGILLQNDIRKSSLIYTIAGIGINVNMNIRNFPEISSIATSLSDEVGRKVSRLEILRNFLSEMERLYFLLPEKEYIFKQWEDRICNLGKEIQVTMGETVYTGIAESVTRDGALMLRDFQGTMIKVIAGDIS